MKKVILFLGLLTLMATSAFALDISAGGAVLLDYGMNTGYKENLIGYTDYYGIRNMSFGGSTFLDLVYAEIDLSFSYGLIKFVWEDDSSGNTIKWSRNSGSMLQIGFGAVLKYPIAVKQIVIFPLAGVDFNLVVYRKYVNGSKYAHPAEYSQLGILAGMGLDNFFSKTFYLRAEAIFHLRFAPKYYKKLADASDNIDTTLGMGPRFKIGIGKHF